LIKLGPVYHPLIWKAIWLGVDLYLRGNAMYFAAVFQTLS